MSNLFFAAMDKVIADSAGRIERMGQQCRAVGNHRVAQNDEPEPDELTAEDLAAIDAKFAPQLRHTIRRESTGTGMGDKTTPTCACGWRGRAVPQYSNVMFTDLLDQERAHMAGLSS